MNIAIVGAGIGGLALAQGLQQSGISFSLYESDESAEARSQGYSIYINKIGLDAMEACLPTSLFKDILQSRSKPNPGINFITEDLRCVFNLPMKSANDYRKGIGIDRSDLRKLLLRGLDKNIHFGKKFAKYSYTEDSKVLVSFDDGSEVVCDMLIGADGVHSKVREQLVGVGVHDTDILALITKVPIDADIKELVMDTPLTTTCCVSGPGGWGGFVGTFEYQEKSFGEQKNDYMFLSILAKKEMWDIGEDWKRITKEDLFEIAQDKVRDWHPAFSKILQKADTQSFAFWSLLSGIQISPWNNSKVTLLGDAAHCMPPTMGLGANLALHDAQKLYEILVKVRDDETPRDVLIDNYVQSMLRSGFSAAEASIKVLDIAVVKSQLKRKWYICLLTFLDYVCPKRLKTYIRSLI